MISSKVVIQKLCPERGLVELHQNFQLQSSWTYESHRTVSDSSGFSKGSAGSETQMHMMDDSTLLFADEYGVPGGFLIGVLFPPNFMPSVFKFRQAPQIPVGTGNLQASM